MLPVLMIGLAVTGSVRGHVIAPEAVPAAPAPTVFLADYEGLRKSAGRDAESQVKLALLCERHGLKAVATSPSPSPC